MSAVRPADLATLTTFGAFLKYLRRRAKMTQAELASACGYSPTHISHLENNGRLPDQAALLALFIPALGLENEPDLVERLLGLSAAARGKPDVPRTHLPFSRGEAPHNLPSQPTSFVGRVEELKQIAELLGSPTCRLLTLSGPGGVGKTRLAIEAARQVASFANGVYFVSLVALSSPDFIAQTIADALHFKFQAGGGDSKEQLLNYLRDRSMLLVLDNFEQLLEGANLLSDILSRAPAVQILITSRVTLNRQEEWVVQIRGMDVPDEHGVKPAEESNAVQLFVERTRRLSSGFELHEHRDAVIRICQLVEGLPLGIELAASWLGILTPQEVANEMARSIDFLMTEMTDIPERQRTIRAVFNHSWSLLSGNERNVLMRLSLFQAGFSHEAAQLVAGAALPVLMSLARKSLIRRDSASGRYTMHELFRQYTQEQLDISGQARDSRQVYVKYYADFLRHCELGIKNRRQVAVLAQLGAEFGNIRKAWEWAVHGEDYEQLAQMPESLFWYGWIQGQQMAIIPLFQEAVAELGAAGNPASEGLGAVIRTRLVRFQTFQGRSQFFRGDIETNSTIAEKHGDLKEIGWCFSTLGDIASESANFPESIANFDKAINIFEKLDEKFLASDALFRQGYSYFASGQVMDGIEANQRSLKLQRETGDTAGMGWSLTNLSAFALMAGNCEESQKGFEETSDIWQLMGSYSGLQFSSAALSLLHFLKGEMGAATRLADEAIELERATNTSMQSRFAILTMGMLANVSGNYAEGRQLCEPVLSNPNPIFTATTYWALAVASLGLSDFESCRNYIQAMLQYAATTQSLGPILWALPVIAIRSAQQKQASRAVELLSLAFARAGSATGWMEKWPLLMDWRERLAGELGVRAYDLASERGSALNLVKVIEELRIEYANQAHSDTPFAANHRSTITTNSIEPDNGSNGAWVIEEPIIKLSQVHREGIPLGAETAIQPLLTPLTKRELEILHLVAAGYSNREIASQLFITPGTAKWHLNAIYSKLGVGRRTQALVRAKELNLLS